MMKTEIFKTTYATYFLHEEPHILEQSWTNEEGSMTEEDYKKDMWNYLKFVKEKSFPLALIDLRKFFFSITPELQVWVDKNITAAAIENIKKAAFLMPADFIERISVELTMDETEAKKGGMIAYFDDRKEAITWLLNPESTSNTTFTGS